MFRLFPVLTLAALLAAGTGIPRAHAQDREFARTVDLQASGTLRIEGSKGSIQLTSWDKPQVEIRARIELPRHEPQEYAQRAVDATEIDVIAGTGSVSIRSNYDQVPTRDGRPGRWGDRTVPAVHYEIRAPRRIDLHVNSDRGPATIRGFEGSINLVVDRGELDLQDAAVDIRLEIDRGERSRLSGIRGRLQIQTDRTDLRIEAVSLDGDSRIEADRGEIELRVPADQRLTVRTDISRRGDFGTDLPVQWTSLDPRRAHGHLNGGGPELFVEAERAHVKLRRR